MDKDITMEIGRLPKNSNNDILDIQFNRCKMCYSRNDCSIIKKSLEAMCFLHCLTVITPIFFTVTDKKRKMMSRMWKRRKTTGIVSYEGS